MQSLTMGSLYIFPLSSMESVFYFICGTTGSVVCLNCFACVALVDSLLNTCTLGVAPIAYVGGKPVAVSGADVFRSSGVHGKSMWVFDLWGLNISHCLCLYSAKYDWSCHVGHFKYGWKCFIINMQVQDT